MSADFPGLPHSVLALDLGGTQLRTAVALADGSLAGRLASKTPRAAHDVITACVAQLNATLAAAREAGAASPSALGISAPGPLDPRSGTLIDPPNLDAALRNFPLAATLSSQMSLPAMLERDTQVAALAEGSYGAGRGLTDFVYLTISTGVGGAVVSGRRLLRGPDGTAGELGHLTVEMDGPECGCGARGHLEALASGTAIARAARAAGLGDLSAAEVAAAEERGDRTAAQIMERARAAFSAALVSIVDIFNPQRVIVGGGIALGQGDRLLGPAREAVARLAFRRPAARVAVVPAALGDDVGLIGARALVGLARLGEDGDLNLVISSEGLPALTSPASLGEDDERTADQQRRRS